MPSPMWYLPCPQRKEEQAALSAAAGRPCLRAATWLCNVMWIQEIRIKRKTVTYAPESLLFL